MLDINFILDNPQRVKEDAANKGININIDGIVAAINEHKQLSLEIQKLYEERNKSVKAVALSEPQKRMQLIKEGKKLKEKIDEKEETLKTIHRDMQKLLLLIPNPAKSDVKVGKDETENEILRSWGEPKKLTFTAKDHLEIGEKLDIIDVERAAKVSGSRFYYLKNDAVLLEFALKTFAFEMLIKEGFIPVLPPVLIKNEIMKSLGYMENGGNEDMYQFPKDDLVLVGTAEQSIVPMHSGEVFQGNILPLRYVGYSSCFRREAGSYGKDTRGILRAHQFDKVEMVSLVEKGQDDKEHEYLLSLEEKLLQALDLPYQVVKMCTGDLGFPAARKYDLEGWIPSENKYRELTSASTTTDFQSRRLNIRYREKGITEYVNILNGTAFSTRPIVAILENYQQEDGSVVIPEVLRKYIGKDMIKPR
jgi:seryl-tRNA synthetase